MKELQNPRRLIIWLVAFSLLSEWCSCYNTLLYSTAKDVRIAVLSKPKIKVFPIVKDLQQAVAVDFYYNGSLVCWTDQGLEVVQCATYNGTHTGAKVTMAHMGVSSPDGLACDWLTKKLYWTDGETNKIEVVSLETKHRKVVYWEELDQPRGIAVDPLEALLFWTDWGEVPKVERGGMNGDAKTRKVLISENLFWPNSVTLDVSLKQLYWLDGKYHLVEVTDYNGKNRRILAEKSVQYPFALALSSDKLYWSDWETLSIHMMDRRKSSNPQEVVHGGVQWSPMDIEVWDSAKQPYKYTPCENKNGGCSHLCLLAPYAPGYSCACPTGIKLLDNFTCAEKVEQFILLVQRTEISKISLDSSDYTKITFPLKDIKNAISLDVDLTDGYFYWTDDEYKNIRRARLDGSKNDTVIANDVYNPDGIAVDWVARNLYWTDMGADRIEVARLDGKYRKVLFVDDLGEPRGIAVSPYHGWLFWSDWNEKKPKIERSDLDGSNRVVLVKDHISWPNGISLDYENSRLYWADAKTYKIEAVGMDGKDRREILTNNLPHVFGISVLGDFVYWTDWERRGVERANKHTGRDRQWISEPLTGVMGLKAVGSLPNVTDNACAVGNGGCEQFCFKRGPEEGGYVCSCEIGYEINLDDKTCALPDAFMMLFDGHKIRRISVQNRRSNDAVPISGVRVVTAMDALISDNKIFWADSKGKTINAASFSNGSLAEKVVEFGLQSPESVAVDWLSRNVYWADTATKRISACKLNGSFRRVIIWRHLNEPRNLILDPREGYMYWSEWGDEEISTSGGGSGGSISRAGMDGTSRQTVLAGLGRVNGMTADLSQRVLYWTSEAGLEVCDLEGGNRKVIAALSHQPLTVAIYKESLYWSNLNEGSIYEAGRFGGKDRGRVLYTQKDRILGLSVVHGGKQTGWNACAANNGGCPYMCLPKPGVSSHTTAPSCACPAQHISKNGTCVPPEQFLLISQRNSFHRVVVDGDDCPDFALAVSGLKNVRALDYDPVEGFVYWIDGKSHAVRRSLANGTAASTVIAGSNNEQFFHDLAVEPYNKLLYWTCSAADTINVTRFDGTALGVVYKGMDGEKPRSIALHPEKGLLFWTDAGNRSRIVASRLDGQRRISLSTDGAMADYVTVDRRDHLLFYAGQGKIFSCQLNGEGKRSFSLGTSGMPKIAGLAVSGGFLYWMDKDSQMLERADKFSSRDRMVVVEQNWMVTDMAAVAPVSKEALRSHPCSSINNHGNCSHLCLVKESGRGYECSCPLTLKLNEDGKFCSVAPVCGPNSFVCHSPGGECIPNTWKCDAHTDCPDASDESDCSACKPHQFQCRDKHCVEQTLVCDQHLNCPDGSDEAEHCAELAEKTNGNNGDGGKAYSRSGSGMAVILAGLAVACVVVALVAVKCRKRGEGAMQGNGVFQDGASLRPLAPQTNHFGARQGGANSMKLPPGMNGVVPAGSGSSTSNGHHSHTTTAGGGGSSGMSMLYSVFPLNPAPSPTTTIQREEYCEYVISSSSSCWRVPPPTPLDTCDESDIRTDSEAYEVVRYEGDGDDGGGGGGGVAYHKSRRTNHDRCHHHSMVEDVYRGHPPTPRSTSSDPPSPSGSVYCQKYINRGV